MPPKKTKTRKSLFFVRAKKWSKMWNRKKTAFGDGICFDNRSVTLKLWSENKCLKYYRQERWGRADRKTFVDAPSFYIKLTITNFIANYDDDIWVILSWQNELTTFSESHYITVTVHWHKKYWKSVHNRCARLIYTLW